MGAAAGGQPGRAGGGDPAEHRGEPATDLRRDRRCPAQGPPAGTDRVRAVLRAHFRRPTGVTSRGRATVQLARSRRAAGCLGGRHRRPLPPPPQMGLPVMTATASLESTASSGLSRVIRPAFTPLSPLNAVRGVGVLAGVLYGWRLWASGWGNPYYSAAVKSMSANLTNFVFGSFDPMGVVTVDKPPMAFWPMVVSAAIFGYHGWSLLLPQVVEGVAAVLLLHRTVRRWAGEHVALLAALIFALTPVTVAINRDTNPDTLMVLLLVAAAYAFTRSVQAGIQPGRATRWLLLAAMFLGLGFVTKMLQAWIVVPAFALAYLVGSATPVRRRVLDLIGAGAGLLASSKWGGALVSLLPAPKPHNCGRTHRARLPT